MEIFDFIFVVICGFGIGVLSGMFGIGGGGMIVPLLHSVIGLPIVAATATSLLTIAPTGISGSIKHLKQNTASLKIGLIVGGSGAIASVGGSLVADSVPSPAVVVLTVLVILFSVSMMLRTLFKSRGLPQEADKKEQESLNLQEVGLREEERGLISAEESLSKASAALSLDEHGLGKAEEDSSKKENISLALPLIIGLIAGGIAGIVGVGGGFIIVPFCVTYLGFSLKKAAGTSLVAISLIAIPGTISHALLGHILWLYGLAIVMGTIPGVQIGAWLIARLPERPMRYAFAGLMTAIGCLMLAQEFLF